MTARQPQSPYEAAMLGLTGLGYPAVTAGPQPVGVQRQQFPPTARRGMFGGGIGRRTPMIGGSGTQYADDLNQPPPISAAPPPPADWRKTVGSDLMAQMPQTPPAPMLGDTLPPAPPMRGGILGSPSRSGGMFGNVASAGLPPMVGSDKIGNRNAPLPDDPNGKGKKGFDWRMLAGVLGDGLLGAVGQAPIYGPNMWKLRQQQAEHQDRMAQMREQARLRYAEPDYSTVGNRRYRYDPSTGEATPLFVAPSEAEDYAAALGFEPGTEGYTVAMQDYALRHSGPTATANAMEEEDNRQTNRVALEGVRQKNRLGVEGVRQGNRLQLRGSPTYRDAHPRPRAAGGSSKVGAGGKQTLREGQVIRGPNGERQIVSGGKLVPL